MWRKAISLLKLVPASVQNFFLKVVHLYLENVSTCVVFFCRYYRALCLMETRFPISHESGHVQVYFTWLDAIQPKKKARQMNIHLEKAAVAFNLAAMHAQEAVLKDKNSNEGYKEAAQGFQVLLQALHVMFLGTVVPFIFNDEH